MSTHRSMLALMAIVLALPGIGRVPILRGASGGDAPMAGSRLTVRQAAAQADAAVLGKGFRLLMGGNVGGRSTFAAEVEVTDRLGGDLPKGPLFINGITFDPGEIPPKDDPGSDHAYILFVTSGGKNGRPSRAVIKMLDGTPENIRAVRESWPDR